MMYMWPGFYSDYRILASVVDSKCAICVVWCSPLALMVLCGNGFGHHFTIQFPVSFHSSARCGMQRRTDTGWLANSKQ